MKIAVRMDDISPGMDWDKFNRFYEMLKTKGIRPLLGVVPCNQDDNLNIEDPIDEESFWNKIREFQEDGCVIAMHGYDHIYTTSQSGLFPLNCFSEFAGVDYTVQKQKLELGKGILKKHGIETDLFMAPAHSFDTATLKALMECGFKRVTDGFGLKPYVYRQLTFYPIAFKQSWSLKRKKGSTTFVVHSNTMSDQEFKKWHNLLNASENAEWINYSELLDIASIRQSVVARMIEKGLANLKHILVKL